MARLVPHLLFRTDSVRSTMAVALRDAGYLVTKVADDDTAARLASFDHVDGMVVDLSAVASIAMVRKIQSASLTARLPILVATASQAVVRRLCPDIDVVDRREAEEEIVSATDLMLARHHSFPLSHAS